jgi:hydrogenase maturation protein HypF
MPSTIKNLPFASIAVHAESLHTRTRQSTKAESPSAFETRRLTIGGRVQGLGVRPAIYRLATELGLAGTVRNTSRGVEIEIEGIADDLTQFERLLPRALPAAAIVTRFLTEPIPPIGSDGFTILKEPVVGPLAASVPEDLAVCPECSREIFAVGNRRQGYPFTSCTLCGPRYTVIRAMPYERDDTAMEQFPMCVDCRREYERPGDRRFHAETTACHQCGPRGWYVGHDESVRWQGGAAIRATVQDLAAGRIVALRGLGGYQLLVDATNEAAVERLRARKGRNVKPLAVMVESAAAERLAYFDPEELATFSDAAAPIVLVRARADNGLATAIHPHIDTVGLMRPTTPLHAILARDFGRPLVCTSGNREGEPLEYEVDAAEKNLADIADAWLDHDRPITRPIDDSVVRIIAGRRVTIRLARGLAPLTLDLPAMPPTLAVGGYLKVAAAWSSGAQSVLGPHIGDQETLAARERYLAHVNDWQNLYRFRPTRLIHDLHPEYFSTQWARSQSYPAIGVQHHHAHVAAGMLEHGWLDRKVLGVAWDGTGYGTDGTIWGGEFLLASAASFERVVRLRHFRLPGGEMAIHEPWRTAAAVCHQLYESEGLDCWPGWSTDFVALTAIQAVINRPQLSPVTSSAGRLFDAAAALILGIDRVSFDGEAAMRLEAAADRTAGGYYQFTLEDGQPSELDWRPLFAELLADCRCGVDPSTIAMRFHRTLAHGIVEVARRWPELPVVLTGGVFQNRLLTELVAELMADEPQPLGLPGSIPPNDGGLAAGQLVIAAANAKVLSCV